MECSTRLSRGLTPSCSNHSHFHDIAIWRVTRRLSGSEATDPDAWSASSLYEWTMFESWQGRMSAIWVLQITDDIDYKSDHLWMDERLVLHAHDVLDGVHYNTSLETRKEATVYTDASYRHRHKGPTKAWYGGVVYIEGEIVAEYSGELDKVRSSGTAEVAAARTVLAQAIADGYHVTLLCSDFQKHPVCAVPIVWRSRNTEGIRAADHLAKMSAPPEYRDKTRHRPAYDPHLWDHGWLTRIDARFRQ